MNPPQDGAHEQKITNEWCRLYGLVRIDFEAALSVTWAIWRGFSCSPRLFWAQIALTLLMQFKGPKQAQAAAKPPSIRPRYRYSHLKITSHGAIQTTPLINSYYTQGPTPFVWPFLTEFCSLVSNNKDHGWHSVLSFSVGIVAAILEYSQIVRGLTGLKTARYIWGILNICFNIWRSICAIYTQLWDG